LLDHLWSTAGESASVGLRGIGGSVVFFFAVGIVSYSADVRRCMPPSGCSNSPYARITAFRYGTPILLMHEVAATLSDMSPVIQQCSANDSGGPRSQAVAPGSLSYALRRAAGRWGV